MDARARRRPSGRPRLDLALLNVLVVNAGSTSLKLSLVAPDETSREVDSLEPPPDDVGVVAHRVVHGGDRFREPVVVDDDVRRALGELSELAPLHNVPALEAMDEARRALPHVPHVAVFDTAFHATLPARASTYAVPRRWRDQWGIRRYGFHGLSVQWAAEQVRVPRLVVCHLGGGCSVTAVRDGRSVETTMGFSPLEGVPMATRSGSIDPAIVLHLLRRLTAEEIEHALEHESGLLGLSGVSARLEELEPSSLAFEVFAYRIATAVGAMAVALGGVDAIVFTGGAGEGSAALRAAVCSLLGFLGDVEIVVVHAREDVVAARAASAAVAEAGRQE